MVKRGKDETYAFNDKELDETIASIGKKNVMVQRYKGLGVSNPDHLWMITMDPETRALLRVSYQDGVEADRIYDILAGEQVELRRQFIEDNSLIVIYHYS